ncbi:MAG: NUDIX hydrolase [Candidatus Woesebacteria bacterium]
MRVRPPPGPHMIKEWTLLSAEDVSPSSWFPIEKRKYQLPDGKVVEDFFVDRLRDVALVVPMTVEGKIIICRQFKPGIGEITYEFPAGRMEERHTDMNQVAKDELQEEAGAIAGDLNLVGQLYERPTKSTERVHVFVGTGVSIESLQKLDETEDIEVLVLSKQEVDQLILDNQIRGSATVGAWYLAKLKFPDLFS